MPFELGAAVGMAEHSGYDHFWYAFDAKRYRALKLLSDLNGTEVYIHNGKAAGILRCLTTPLRAANIGQPSSIYRLFIATLGKPL